MKRLAMILIVLLIALLAILALTLGKQPKEEHTDDAVIPTEEHTGAAVLPTEEYTDVAVLSTTDMHGKCWDINLLTQSAEKNNMLRVSTAVDQIREEYGAENVLVIDNGDLFQGTPVSQIQLFQFTAVWVIRNRS